MEAEGHGAGKEATPRGILTGGQTSRLGIGDSDGEEAKARKILTSGQTSWLGIHDGEEMLRKNRNYAPTDLQSHYKKPCAVRLQITGNGVANSLLQDIKADMQVENSELQLDDLRHSPFGQNLEVETESTASSPQPPLPRGKGHSSLPEISRPEPEMRFPKPAGVRNGASGRAIPRSGEPRPAGNPI